MEVGFMAAIPVGIAFLLLVPAPDAQALSTSRSADSAAVKTDPAVNRAGFETAAPRVALTSPPLPSRTLPKAVDNQGFIYEPVIPADFQAPVSAEHEARPSPQQPRRVTELPPLAPSPAGSPEPSA
jgi:hypothetical protein